MATLPTVGILELEQRKKRDINKRDAGFLICPPVTMGFNQVISEAAEQHQVEYVGIDGGGCEFVLVSLVSWMDVYSLLRVFGRKRPNYKLIVGGPGVINVYPFRGLAWAACFGRGEGLINRIIDGDYSIPSVWFADHDPEVCQKYTIGQATQQLSDGRETESVVGCPRSCYYCHYSWKHKYVSFGQQYSEYDNGQTHFQNLNINDPQSTVGIDGLTERARYIVNKPLSNDAIVDKLTEPSALDMVYIKPWVIVAYPFEEPYIWSEWEETMQRIAERLAQPMTIMIMMSHFRPMPLTPMEQEPVTFAQRDGRWPMVETGKLKWGTFMRSTTSASAVWECMLYRSREDDDIQSIIQGSNKIMDTTARKIAEKFPHVVEGGYVPVPYLRRTRLTMAATADYKRRCEEKR